MVIVREKQEKKDDEEILLETSRENEYTFYRCLCKIFGAQPLPKEKWMRGIVSHRAKILPFVRKIANLP